MRIPVLLSLGGLLVGAFVPIPLPADRLHICRLQSRRRDSALSHVGCAAMRRSSPVLSVESLGGADGDPVPSLLDKLARRFNPFQRTPKLLSRLRPGMQEHDREIAMIAIPALLALLADPFLTVVDSAYVGRMGSVTLAALGPCTSIFHLSFNGFRAFAQSTTALVSAAVARKDTRRVRQVVVQAMALAVGVGTLVAWVLRAKSVQVLSLMGAIPGSELSRIALPYLRIRAIAAPVVLLLMVCEGTFRGAGDTLTPLPVTGAIAWINLVLDPYLMFRRGMGLAGAAVATVVAQYIGAVLYLALLFSGNRRSPLTIAPARSEEEEEEDVGEESSVAPAAAGEEGRQKGKLSWMDHVVDALPVFATIMKANAAMIVRNGTLLATWALATASATRIGLYEVAAHQVVLSVWLFGALISESPGIAAQVLSARYQSIGRKDLLRSLARRLLEMGTVLGLSIGTLFVASRDSLPLLFADHPVVIANVSRLLLVAGLQMPLVALALIFEGMLVGCGRFTHLAWSSTLSSAACAALLLVIQRCPTATGVHVWLAIKALFVFRLLGVLVALFDRKRSPLRWQPGEKIESLSGLNNDK